MATKYVIVEYDDTHESSMFSDIQNNAGYLNEYVNGVVHNFGQLYATFGIYKDDNYYEWGSVPQDGAVIQGVAILFNNGSQWVNTVDGVVHGSTYYEWGALDQSLNFVQGSTIVRFDSGLGTFAHASSGILAGDAYAPHGALGQDGEVATETPIIYRYNTGESQWRLVTAGIVHEGSYYVFGCRLESEAYLTEAQFKSANATDEANHFRTQNNLALMAFSHTMLYEPTEILMGGLSLDDVAVSAGGNLEAGGAGVLQVGKGVCKYG